jgi:hypothetical protein
MLPSLPSMQSTCALLCHNLWPVWLYHIFHIISEFSILSQNFSHYLTIFHIISQFSTYLTIFHLIPQFSTLSHNFPHLIIFHIISQFSTLSHNFPYISQFSTLSHNFPHYLISGAIFVKHLWNTKSVF